MANIKEFLIAKAEEREESYHLSQSIELPPLLCSESELVAFERPCSIPNFITRKKVIAETVNLSTESTSIGDMAKQDLQGKIVLIPQADPGFDWLFGHKIGGLITMYGGANSHMSIRAAEFGVPAAIGVGESLYDQLFNSKTIELCCASRLIRVIQ